MRLRDRLSFDSIGIERSFSERRRMIIGISLYTMSIDYSIDSFVAKYMCCI